MQARSGLRRHSGRLGAGRIVPRWEQLKGKAALGIGCGGVSKPSCGVYQNDGGARNAAAGGIGHRTAKGASGGVLCESNGCEQEKTREEGVGKRERDEARHRTFTCM